MREALTAFAAVVRRCRRGAGFPTARAFYRGLGGRAFFGVSYRAYASLEVGGAAPKPELVERLAAAFRFAHHPQVGREFARTYLRILLGSDELMDLAREAFAGAAEAPQAQAGADEEAGWLGAEEARVLGAPRTRAGLMLEHPLLLRASRAELEGYYPHVEKVAERAVQAARRRGGEPFVVETRLVKLLDF